MSELKIPSADVLQKSFRSFKIEDKRESKSALEATLQAYNAKFDPEEHPICAALGEEAFNRVCNFNTELMERGVPTEKRVDEVTDMLDNEMEKAIPVGSREAAILERAMARAAHKGELDIENEGATIKSLAKKVSWLERIRSWFRFDWSHYSSVRGGTSSGTTGWGWRKKWRTLRVVATTHASSVTVKLFGFPIGTKTTIGCLVVSTHFRAPWGLIPKSASPLRAGAIRNGSTQVKSRTGWICSKATLFIDSDPDKRNLTYFGNSSDAGISLSVSGTP